MNSLEEQRRLPAAFEASNAINDLLGVPFTDDMRLLQQRVIRGEISIEQAIQQLVEQFRPQ